MKKTLSKILCALSLIALLSNGMAFGTGIGNEPDVNSITVTNNSGRADTVVVEGLFVADVVKVYNAATGGFLLGTATVGANSFQTTVTIPQLGTSAGKIYVSVTRKDSTESNRVTVSYEAEGKTEKIDADSVTVTNNSGLADTVYIASLAPQDAVKIYSAATGGRIISTLTVPNGKYDATLTIPQLGISAGNIFITVKSLGMLESDRVQVSYDKEELSDRIDVNSVDITNNCGKADTILIDGLEAGDVIKVYPDLTSRKIINTATVQANRTSTTLTIGQLGASAGKVYITRMSRGRLEGPRVAVNYDAEPKTDKLDEACVTITNNAAGTADTILVEGLMTGDVVKVYSAATGTKTVGTATTGVNKTSVAITVSQLGSNGGIVYISVTSSGYSESDRLAIEFEAEPKSEKLLLSDVEINNNGTGSDTIIVDNLEVGDIIKVYRAATGTTTWGTSTVGANKTSVTITVRQLSTKEGTVYITVKGKGKLESDRLAVNYEAEEVTDPVDVNDVNIINNASAKDTISVTKLNEKDIVKVYKASTGTTTWGTATVATGNNSVNINVTQLGTSSGSVYISVTSVGKLESSRVKVDYTAEGSSKAVSAENVLVANNVEAADVIRVTGLNSNDVVKIYNAPTAGTVLGTGTVGATSTFTTISIPQLGTNEGTIYVTVTSAGKSESARVAVNYAGESVNSNISASNVIVTNNSGVADTITVRNITSGDIIKVYDSPTATNLLGTATVDNSSTSVTISVPQLGVLSGSVYISVKSINKTESGLSKIDYAAESASNTPNVANITVVNNYGIAGTVTVKGLRGNDLVKVYSTINGVTVLGTGTVGTYSTEVTVSVGQLDVDGGKIYISTTSAGKLESSRTEVEYTGKTLSTAPAESNITVYNYTDIQSAVEVTGLKSGDIVKIYDLAINGNVLGTATVATNSTRVKVTVSDLNANGGKVYVSVRNTGKTESDRTAKTYGAQEKTTQPNASRIVIENNSGIADTIKVAGLEPDDVVNVYTSRTTNTVLGSASAGSNDTEATVSIRQLGTLAGTVYISVTSYGKLESDRVEVSYVAESVAIDSDKVTVVNNAGVSSTITVTGLSNSDTVKVYDSASGGTLLGSAVSTSTGNITIKTTKLSETSGYIYVTVTNFGRKESSRTKVQYSGLELSTSVIVNNVEIINNASISDKIIITGLLSNDYVKIYDSFNGTKVIGSTTVASNSTIATITITDLGEEAGSVYISVTSLGKIESDRTEVKYLAEPMSNAPSIANVEIVNNKVGTADEITVIGLQGSDAVKIYDAATGGNLIGSGIASTSGTSVNIKISQLGTVPGTVYISVISTGKRESTRVAVQYAGE